jgi:hypothetical protein
MYAFRFMTIDNLRSTTDQMPAVVFKYSNVLNYVVATRCLSRFQVFVQDFAISGPTADDLQRTVSPTVDNPT